MLLEISSFSEIFINICFSIRHEFAIRFLALQNYIRLFVTYIFHSNTNCNSNINSKVYKTLAFKDYHLYRFSTPRSLNPMSIYGKI